MKNEAIGDSADLKLPGFKTRHQVEFQSTDWSGVLNLLSWINDERGHVAYLKSKMVHDGRIEVAIGVEAIGGHRLQSEILASNSFTSSKIEHLFVREQDG